MKSHNYAPKNVGLGMDPQEISDLTQRGRDPRQQSVIVLEGLGGEENIGFIETLAATTTETRLPVTNYRFFVKDYDKTAGKVWNDEYKKKNPLTQTKIVHRMIDTRLVMSMSDDGKHLDLHVINDISQVSGIDYLAFGHNTRLIIEGQEFPEGEERIFQHAGNARQIRDELNKPQEKQEKK